MQGHEISFVDLHFHVLFQKNINQSETLFQKSASIFILKKDCFETAHTTVYISTHKYISRHTVEKSYICDVCCLFL